MELKLNPTAEKVLKYGLENYQLPDSKLQKLLQKLRQENRLEDMGNLVIGGYLVSLIGACQRTACDFGLTYDTVKTIPTALAALYREQKDHMSPQENARSLGATISVYLTLLCTNEHECPLNYRMLYSPMMNPEAVQKLLQRSFSGISITTGTKEQVDFYEAGQQCLSSRPILMEKGLYISMEPAIRAYKKATGIDLAQYGLTDVMISG